MTSIQNLTKSFCNYHANKLNNTVPTDVKRTPKHLLKRRRLVETPHHVHVFSEDFGRLGGG